MKKLFVLALTIVMLVLATGVAAESVELKIEPILNYSADAVVSLEFNTAEEFTEDAIGDIGMAPAIIDPVMFFETLLSFDGTATVKADISEDYNKIKLSMEADYDYDVDVNPNLGVGLDLKLAAWLDMDISDLNNPKCNIIMYTPMSTKYMYLNLFDYIPDDGSRLFVIAILKSVLNESFVDDLNQTLLDSYEKYAEISADGDVLTIKLSNDAYLKMIDEVTPLLVEKILSVIPVPAEELGNMEIPSVSDLGIQLLGENGVVVKYNTKDFSSEINCDMNIDISSLMAATGEDMYGPNVSLGFTMTGTEKYYDIGTTEVVLPELTEENSIGLYDAMFPEDYYEEDYYEEEYETEYPFFYASAYAYYMPDVEGKLYVPFRALLEDAYGGNVDIGFENGLVTATSEYFTNFEKLTFKSGENKANVDGTEIEVGAIVLKDGVTYVSTDFFETVFGWELDSASYDYIYGEYYFGFFTEALEEEYIVSDAI